jgi:hypothetical protein
MDLFVISKLLKTVVRVSPTVFLLFSKEKTERYALVDGILLSHYSVMFLSTPCPLFLPLHSNVCTQGRYILTMLGY